mgnify:CR=1 FL=1
MIETIDHDDLSKNIAISQKGIDGLRFKVIQFIEIHSKYIYQGVISQLGHRHL